MLDRLKGILKSEHRYAQKNLSAYLDGEMNAREKAMVERHLQGCAECRQDLAALRQTVDLLRLVPEVPLPRSFLVSVTEIGREAMRRPIPTFFAMRTVSILATALLVLISSGNLLLSNIFAPQEAGQVLQATTPSSETLVLTESARVAEAAAPQAITEQPKSPAQAAPGIKAVATEAVAQAASEPTVNLIERAVTAMKAPSVPSAAVATTAAPPASSATGSGVAVPTPLAAASPVTDQIAVAEKSYGETAALTGSRDSSAKGPASLPERLPFGARPDLRAVLNGAMWMLLIVTVTLWAVTAVLHDQQH